MNARPHLVITLILSFLGTPSVAPAQQETVADYTAIAQPTIAGKLSLSDEQRARVAKLLDDRFQALQGASPADRSKIIQDSNQKLSELLTPEQKTIFTALASRGQLRFNFRKQKWADVLDWFARQSKLSLVMDTTPEGTFTYSDSKDYSPAEAIDLLNSVLQTKGFTLLRKNGILLVVDTSEGIPFEMTPKVTAPGLLDRGRFEIVTLELPIATRDPITCLETARELIGPNGRVIPLGNAKKLLVTDTAGKLLAINEAVSAIPLPKSTPKPKPAPKPVLAVYPINGLDADATVETLQALFSSGTIRADASAEEIHVYATPETQTGVKASVNKMLDAISDRRKPQLQIYPVETKTPEQLVEQLLIAAPKAQVTFDEPRSRLLVVANAEQQESVQATVKKLGADGAQTLAEDNVVIYPIQQEATESLTTLLQAVIPRALVVAQPGRIAVRGRPHEQKTAKATIDQFQELKKTDEKPTLKLYTFEKELDNELVESIQATVPDATLTRLAEGKRLYALAKAKDQALIAATLKQLETDLPLAAAQKLQVYSLDQMESEEVETLLSSIVPAAQVRSDSTGKRLLIWALAKEHEVISTTLEQLKENLPRPDTKKLQVYPLGEIAFSQVETVLTQIVPDAQIQSDTTGKRLLIWAHEKEHVVINATLTQLQQDLPLPDTKKLQVYPLGEIAFSQVETVLTQIVPDAQIQSDTTGKRLLIWAQEKEHVVINATLTQLQQDLPLTDTKKLQVYPLGKIVYSQIESVLTSIAPEAQIRADTTGKRLLIWASPKEHAIIADTLKQVNNVPLEKPTLATYELPREAANEILETVQSLIPDAQVTLDSSKRRLLVIGLPQAQTTAASLVKKLTTGTQSARRVLIAYSLQKADPAVVVEMLQELQPDIRFAADRRARRVLVTAPLPLQARLQAIIEQLDAAPDAQLDKVAHTYHVDHVSAESLIELLQSLYPDMKFVAEPSDRKLMASGTKQDHQKLSLTLERMDAGSPEGSHVKTYPTGESSPSQLANVLIQLVPTAVISTNKATKRLIIWADKDGHTAIGQAVEQFTSRDAKETRTLKTYSLPQTAKGVRLRDTSGPQAILELMQDALPEATLSLDETNERVIAWAAEADHKTIQTMLKEFSRNQPNRSGVHLKTHRAAPDVLSNAEPLLADVAPKARQVETTESGTWLIWASPKEQQAIGKLLVDLEKQLALTRPRRVLKTHTVSKANRSMAEQLIEEAAPQATVLDSTVPNQILVQATEQDQESIAAILQSLASVLKKPQTTLHVYPIDPRQSSLIQDIISRQAPGATLLENIAPGQLIIQAADGEHETIAALLEDLSKKLLQPAAHIQVYPVTKDQAAVARELINQVAPQATILESPYDNKLVVTALPTSHLNIATALKEIASLLTRPGTTVRVYPVDRNRLQAQTALDNFDDGLTTGTSIQVNKITNSLIVRATSERHAQISQALSALMEQLPVPDTPTTQVYALKLGSPEAVQEALSPLVTSGTVVADPSSGSVIVTANAEEQQRAANVVKQLDQVPSETATVKAYRIKQADPEALYESLSQSFGRGQRLDYGQFAMQFQAATSSIYVIATPKNHAIFQELIEELDQPDTKGTVVRVYPFDEARIDAQQVVNSLDTGLTKSMSLQVNEKVNSLIARGSQTSQDKLQVAIEEIVKHLPKATTPTTQVYALKLGSPEAVQEALSPLVTSGTVVADPSSGSVIVTANAEEQQRAAEVVKQLDQVPGQTPTVRAYRIRNADPFAVFRSVNEAFRDNDDFSLSFQDATRSIYLVATPVNHAVFKTLLEELDQPGPPRIPRSARVYSLENVDGNVAVSILNTLFVGQNVQIQFNPTANALVVIAAEHQHASVARSLQEMTGVERILEVFNLQFTDPLVIETAVTNLYTGSAPGSAPTVSSDFDTQRIFVRGTKTQIERIRQLLISLGEPVRTANAGPQKGGVRTIPFHGSTEQAVEQLEKVWNKLRKNRIQVIMPRQPDSDQDQPVLPQPSPPPVQERKPGSSRRSSQDDTSVDARHNVTIPVLWQDTTRKPEPAKPTKPAPEDPRPSIVVVPGQGQITIASSDTEALDEMEQLLRSISQRSGRASPNSNFSVFFLRNTGAKDIQTLLNTLIEQLPTETRSGMGPIAVVADKRLNALVVHGNRKDREILQELLEVLDTAETLSPTSLAVPVLVPLQNTQASRILAILRNVYKTQLSSSGGRKTISIPEGVSDDVAALLQQMNASASGPILSLDLDEKTNSIVVRALPDLSQEIRSFIQQLDTTANEITPRRVRVIQLENTRSDRMLQLLQQFLESPSQDR